MRPYAILLKDLQRSEESLRQQAAELQTRSEELDAYDHTVAHNLKNPLTVIIASAEAITDIGDLTRAEQREFMGQIKATAFEMNSIIDNLLLLAELRKAEAPVGSRSTWPGWWQRSASAWAISSKRIKPG